MHEEAAHNMCSNFKYITFNRIVIFYHLREIQAKSELNQAYTILLLCFMLISIYSYIPLNNYDRKHNLTWSTYSFYISAAGPFFRNLNTTPLI